MARSYKINKFCIFTYFSWMWVSDWDRPIQRTLSLLGITKFCPTSTSTLLITIQLKAWMDQCFFLEHNKDVKKLATSMCERKKPNKTQRFWWFSTNYNADISSAQSTDSFISANTLKTDRSRINQMGLSCCCYLSLCSMRCWCSSE